MDRSRDPAGIAPNKAHLLVNIRRDQGGWVSRGGQAKLFPDRLHPENVGEGGADLWDENTGIGNITGIDPGADLSRYGGSVLYCGTGTELSTWDGATQRDYRSITAYGDYGAGDTSLPMPLFDEANGATWGYRTILAIDGSTKLYRLICRLGYVNNIFGGTPIVATPLLTGWGGPYQGQPSRLTWSVVDERYYVITPNGLVFSFTEAGDVDEEEDHSLDTATAKTVYGAPVIFETQDELVYLVGYGNGTSEPTTMQAPLCYVKNLFTGVWTIDNSITGKFVPTTKPVLFQGSIHVGGYEQAAASDDDKQGCVYIWQGSGSGWAQQVAPMTGNSQVRGLCQFGYHTYYLYDDVVNVGNSILGRFGTGGTDATWKVFQAQNETASSGTNGDGLFGYRGNLYARLYSTVSPYVGDGLLWRSPGAGALTSGTWVVAPNVAAPGQELNGAPIFAL